jgi:hypothetical protein
MTKLLLKQGFRLSRFTNEILPAMLVREQEKAARKAKYMLQKLAKHRSKAVKD